MNLNLHQIQHNERECNKIAITLLNIYLLELSNTEVMDELKRGINAINIIESNKYQIINSFLVQIVMKSLKKNLFLKCKYFACAYRLCFIIKIIC